MSVTSLKRPSSVFSFFSVAGMSVALLALMSSSVSAAPGSRTRSGSGAPPPTAVAQERIDQEPVFRFSRPIVRIGQNFSLGENETVREIQSGLADITVAGHVEDNVAVIVGSLRLASTARIDDSVVVVGGTLTIDPGATVQHDLIVIGGALNAPADFTAGGQQVVVGSIGVANTLHALVPWFTQGLLLGRPVVPTIQWIWIALAIFLFIYLMIAALFANPVRAVAEAVTARPVSSFLLGLLVLVLTAPVIAILAATVIGIAIVPFLLCALVIGGVIGKAGVLRATGRSVLPEDEDAGRIRGFGSILIGFAVLTIAYMIPVLGFITWALTGVIGLGGATAAFRSALRREHPARVRAPLPIDPVATEARVIPAAEPAYAAPAAGFVPDATASAYDAAGTTVPPSVPPAIAPDLGVYPRATFLDRVAAFALDAILVGIAVNVLDLTRHDGWFPLLLVAYHIAFWAWRGTTLGGIVVGLRVLRVQGTELRFADALVRGLSSVFSVAALGIGCLWMLQDPEKQMWHDKIAGTLVVKVPRHLVLP